jgi:LytS/YehU family sensor histidine kinase
MDENIRRKLRPHYLFNELGIIRYMIKKDPGMAYDMIYDFSKYLRGNVGALAEDGLVQWSEELEYIKAYLRLEQCSYGDRLKVVYEVSGDCMVPQRSIILLVENAIKHGIAPNDQTGTLTIRGCEVSGGYQIDIVDDGVGFEPSGVETPGLDYVRNAIGRLPGSTLEVESWQGLGTEAHVFMCSS